jgi:hypothetical protein
MYSLLQKIILTQASVLVLSMGTSFAQRNLTSANNQVFTINDQAGGQLTAPAPLNQWPKLCVRAACVGGVCTPCTAEQVYDVAQTASTTELNGRQIVMAAKNMQGVQVVRRIFVPDVGQSDADGFVRYVDSFTNNTTSPITISVSLGSITVGNTQTGYIGNNGISVWRTSSDDANVDLFDRWFLFDDNNATAGNPSITVFTHGAGSVNNSAYITPTRLQSATILQNQAFSWDFDNIVVPRQATVSLITLVVAETQRTAGLDEIDNLLKLKTVDAAFGLTTTQRDSVINADINSINACPIADIGGPYSGDEGSTIQLSAVKSFDAEGLALNYRWDLDNDGQFDDAVGANASLLKNQNGSYIVKVEVTDNGNKTDIDQAIINVRNVNPSISTVTATNSIFEGDLATVNVTASDLGTTDILTYEYDWKGDGNYVFGNAQATYRYITDGLYRCSVRVKDQDGGVAIGNFDINVQNKAPVVQQVIANNPSTEGANVRFIVQAFDAGQDPITYGFDFDNDTIIDQTSVNGEGNHIFPQDGNYTVGIYAYDQQNTLNTSVPNKLYNVAVLNAAPSITTLSLSAQAKEGEPVDIIVQATDPGVLDRLTYAFDVDEDPGYEVIQDSPVLSHVFPDNGVYVIRAQVIDEDNATASKELVVDVINQIPFGSLRFEGNVREDSLASADQGIPFDVYADILDPSAIDELSLTFSWDLNNDGIYERIDAGRRQTLQFDREGRYTIRMIARDKDLGEQIFERDVLIAGRLPVIQDLEILTPPPYEEGQNIRFRLLATDPDPLLYQFDFNGDGNAEVPFQNQIESQFAYTDDGQYEIICKVKDDTGEVTFRKTINIQNDIPDVELNVGANVGEGESLEVQVVVHDKGQDQISFEWRYANLSGIIDLQPEERKSFFIPTQDDGFIVITGTATDDDQGVSQEASLRALIQNRPPFFPPAFEPLSAVEGQAYNRVLPADDPAGINDSLTFGLINPPENVEIDAVTGLLIWTPTYEDYLNSPMSLRVTVSDEDGGTLTQELNIPVLPRDADNDGIPDQYEEDSCMVNVNCLSTGNADDAQQDPDLDSRTNLEEYLAQTDPFVYEGPGVPNLILPQNDAKLLNYPTLTVSKVTSNLESVHPIEIVFEIYTDSTLNNIALTSQPQAQLEGLEIVEWATLGQGLGEDQVYYWRARSRMLLVAEDIDAGIESKYVLSAWTDAYSFRVNSDNHAPSAPVLLMPSNQGFVNSLQPTFQFNRSSDSDGDAIDYVLRIYRQTELGSQPDSAARILSATQNDPSMIVFTLEDNLQENTTYEWDVVAIDEFGTESMPSEKWSFTLDQNNESPSDPTIVYPEEGTRVTNSLTPTFKATGCIDPEGQRVAYHFQLQVRGSEMIFDENAEIYAEGGLAQWTISKDMEEDLDYVLTVSCSDGQMDSMAVSRSFFFTFKDNAPPAPTLLSPGNGDSVSKDAAILVWSEVEDPERGDVRYVVSYCDQGGNCETSVPVLKTSLNVADMLVANQPYQWRVKALDEAGNESDYSDPRTVIVIGAGAKKDGGCQSSNQGFAWYLLISMLLLLGWRRKV